MGSTEDWTLDQLLLTPLDQLAVTFSDHIQQIYDHDANEIQEILVSLNVSAEDELLKVLNATACSLYAELCVKLPEYSSRELFNRRKSQRRAYDIYIIGFAMVNNLDDIRLRKITKGPRPAGSSPDESFITDNNADLLETCLQLKASVEKLSTTVNTLTTEINALKEKLDSFPPQGTQPVQNAAPQNNAQATDTSQPVSTTDSYQPVSEENTGAVGGRVETTSIQNDASTTAANSSLPTAPSASRVNQQTQLNGVAEDDPEEAPFTLPHDQRARIRSGRAFTGSQRQPIIGTAESLATIQGAGSLREPVNGTSTTLTTIQGVDLTVSPRSVYVGRLADSVTVTSLRSHLRQVGIDGITDVIDLKCRTAGQSSFCIVVDGDTSEGLLYNGANWPVGTKIRPFGARNNNARQSSNSREQNKQQRRTNNRQSGVNNRQRENNSQRLNRNNTSPPTGREPTHQAPRHTFVYNEHSFPPLPKTNGSPNAHMQHVANQPANRPVACNNQMVTPQCGYRQCCPSWANRFSPLSEMQCSSWIPVV